MVCDVLDEEGAAVAEQIGGVLQQLEVSYNT